MVEVELYGVLQCLSLGLNGSYDGKLVPDSFRTRVASQLGVGTWVQSRHDGSVDGVGRAFVGNFLVGITPVNPQQVPS